MRSDLQVSVGDSENALGDERTLVVDGECGERGSGIAASIGFAEEQESRVVGNDARLEINVDFASIRTGKGEGFCGRLCHRGGLG